MSTTIIVLKSADAATSFLADAQTAGVAVEPVAGLPRFFKAAGVSPEDFPLKGHPSIALLDDGDRQGQAQEQVVTVNGDGTGDGGWCAARVIRRRNPWRLPSRGPVRTSSFRSVRTGEGVDIYIIDSGVDVEHPEFAGRASQPWLFDPTYVTPHDDSGHGTHCMALAGGLTVGIARGARLYSFKMHNGNSGAGTEACIAALGAVLQQYQAQASSDRAGVVTFSWSGFGSSVNAAISDLIDAGMVFCASAGNDLLDLATIDLFPAESDPDGIICGGTNISDFPYFLRTHGSNWGADVDICAPAQWTLSARRSTEGGGYRIGSGTSYATPLVAGAVACMLQGYRRPTTRAEVQAVKAKLLANATVGALRPGYIPSGVPADSAEDGQVLHALPDRLLYLDPLTPFEVIPGLTPRTA